MLNQFGPIKGLPVDCADSVAPDVGRNGNSCVAAVITRDLNGIVVKNLKSESSVVKIEERDKLTVCIALRRCSVEAVNDKL